MANTISIIPYPILVIEKNGIFNISNNTVVISPDFTKEIKSSVSSLLSKASINCKFNNDNPNIVLIKSDSYKNYSLSNKESYCIDVADDKITLWASADPGFYYGFVTLTQLFMQGEGSISQLFIYDKPQYEWRGFMLDVSRSFYTVEFVKKVIDLCAFHKLNRFHWHLTDDQGWRVPIREYPLLTEIGGKRVAPRKPRVEDGYDEYLVIRRRYYNEEEIADIVKYASERFITIVPEIELPGHASALLASYPEFGCTQGPYQVEHRWGIFHEILCAGNDKIFDLYDKIFENIARMFPGQYVHIGGDECRTPRWEKCPKCQKRMKDENLVSTAQLQTWVTAKMVKLLEKHGKTPIGWDEVLDNTEIIPVPDDLIVQSWRGIEGGEKATELKHKVIMSPQTMCYTNLKPYDNFEEPGMLGFTTIEKAYSFTPVTAGMKEENAHLVLGGEGALWTEEIRSSRLAEYLMFPRLCAIAECLWLPESSKDFDRFNINLVEHKKRLDKLDVLYYKGPAK